MATHIDSFRVQIAEPDALRQIEKDAPSDLKHHFDLIKKGLEAIPGVPGEAIYHAVTLRALALKPSIFTSWFLTEYHSVKQGEVPSKVKELLATIISGINEEDECQACTPYHAGDARYEGASEAEIRAIARYEEEKEALDSATRRIIDFGIKSAFHPREVTNEDVAGIRDLGYSDAAIVEIVSSALIAYNLSALNQVLNLREG